MCRGIHHGMSLVDIHATAEWLGVSPAKVRSLVREHGLPAIDLGHRTQRFDLEQVAAWARGRTDIHRGPVRVPARRA